jgi:uncharacterized protein YciI
MATFHVVVHRSGPEWKSSAPLEEQSGWIEHADFMEELVDQGFIVLGGPLSDEYRVVHVVEAASEEDVRSTLARDPWSETHLQIAVIEPWTIRLDARGARRHARSATVRPDAARAVTNRRIPGSSAAGRSATWYPPSRNATT